ncbi:MAG: glutamate--tRNA ligase [Acetobacteraceae bacterium]|nr:glutamate--tRNA ligase [Acetobacteraceae bacterium]
MTRVRFIAPPSGGLLITGARVALANHAFAKNRRGTFVLRAAADDDRTLSELSWLGVEWNEIGKSGDYAGAIQHLKDTGRLYPCFESEVELRAKREFRIKRGRPATYDRAMLKLTPEQRASAEAGGKQPYWRFRLSNRLLNWNDMISGRREAKLPMVSDPVLVTADGAPTTALTSVIDDVSDSVTHVIRADEGDGTTGIYLDLLEAFGENPDQLVFGHLPVLGDTGRLAVRALRADGIEAEGLSRWIGAGGRFSARQFARNPDAAMLPSINREVLARRDFADVADRLPAGATEPFWLAIRGHVDLLNEARHWWDVVNGAVFPPIPTGSGALIQAARAALPPEPWDPGTWAAWRANLPPGSDDTLRLLLTGEEQGPELASLLPLISRFRVLERLRGA